MIFDQIKQLKPGDYIIDYADLSQSNSELRFPHQREVCTCCATYAIQVNHNPFPVAFLITKIVTNTYGEQILQIEVPRFGRKYNMAPIKYIKPITAKLVLPKDKICFRCCSICEQQCHTLPRSYYV